MKIKSFEVDHTRLRPGVYLSRTDGEEGNEISTFDIRLTIPNREPPVDMPALHTIEHLGATYLRNSDIKDDVVYFGPMGCRTGCYMLLRGKRTAEEAAHITEEMCDFILGFGGDIPGATEKECGNWREHNLKEAKYYISRFLRLLKTERNLKYPD